MHIEVLEEIVDNENNLISEFLDSIDDEVQENNLISEFLESIDTDNPDITSEEELLDALNNIINTSFNNYTNNNNNIQIPTPFRFFPFINIIQQESEEDFEMQQAIQRSIEER